MCCRGPASVRSALDQGVIPCGTCRPCCECIGAGTCRPPEHQDVRESTWNQGLKSQVGLHYNDPWPFSLQKTMEIGRADGILDPNPPLTAQPRLRTITPLTAYSTPFRLA